MKRIFAITCAIFSCLLFLPKAAIAVDPGLNWKTIESEHLYVHYADGNKAVAETVLAIAEAAHRRLTEELNWHPREKTHVIVSDEIDQPNGFATPIYFNRTVIYLAPPTGIDTLEDFDDWLSTLILHEYAHIVHLDKSAGSPEYLKNIIGRFFLLFPNLFQPGWIIEGVATLKETNIERAIGRGQSTMFASMMREEVANGLQPVSHVNLPVNTWPAGNTRYLYGVYFMEFLVQTYGEDKLNAWIEEYSNNLLPYFINTNAEQVLGKDLTSLWHDFEQWLNEKFQPQIKAIEARGIRKGVRLSADAYRTGPVRAAATDSGDEIYYVRNNGYRRASLVRIDPDGHSEELIDLNNGADLDLHPAAGLLLTQNEFCNNYTIYKDIYYYDTSNHELQRLTECGRYLFASWFPDGRQIIAVHHQAGRFELQLLDINARTKEVLWQAANGEILGQPDVSPDGKLVVASLWRKGSGWNLELFGLANKRWQRITRGTSITAYPQYDPDSNILFSMEAEGVYNLFRYYSASGKIEQLTNLPGGAFQPMQASKGGAVYYTGYTAEGYTIYRLDADKPDMLNQNTTVAASLKLEDDHLQSTAYSVSQHRQTDYSALSNMYPRWWFPTFYFSEQRSEFGLTTSGNDALGIHNYAVTASYDSKLNRPAWELSYAYADRLFLSVARSNEIIVDANGDLNRVSNRDVASTVLAFPDYYIQKQLNLLFSAIYDKTTDNTLAAGALPFEDYEDNLLGIAWLYNSAVLNPLSISLNDGMKLRMVAEDSDTLNSDYSGQTYTLDWRQYIRAGKESVFALRFLQGWGTDRPQPFQLGGEGINYNTVNILLGFNNNEAVFDQRKYALRGYQEGLPQLRGRRAQLFSAEWRFPVERPESGFMAPPVGLMQWSGAVFAETGSAYRDSPETYYTSAGIELTADINLFYQLTLRTRAGFAHGFDKSIGDNRLYLMIGSSF
ncbi:MAG: hypothetical protein LJE83_07505 [Gammaproteobacteria bacterium]|nr:hypothetical protein [Gammaproteobacteria bacterium]